MQGYGPPFVRVFVLDDHDIVRRGLIDLLSKPDIHVVGDSGSMADATRRILDLKPDVMLLDVHLQDGSGVQVCRDVRAVDPTIRGLLLTAAGDEEASAMAVLAGAAGYLAKLVGTHDITDSVRRVAAGRPIPGQASAEQGRAALLDLADRLDPPLSRWQRAALPFVLDGATDRQLAERLDEPPAEVRDGVAELVTRVIVSATPSPGRSR